MEDDDGSAEMGDEMDDEMDDDGDEGDWEDVDEDDQDGMDIDEEGEGSGDEDDDDWTDVFPPTLLNDFQECLADGQSFDESATAYAGRVVEYFVDEILHSAQYLSRGGTIRPHEVMMACVRRPDTSELWKRFRADVEKDSEESVIIEDLYRNNAESLSRGMLVYEQKAKTKTEIDALRRETIVKYLAESDGILKKINYYLNNYYLIIFYLLEKAADHEGLLKDFDGEDEQEPISAGSSTATTVTSNNSDGSSVCAACDGPLGNRYIQLPCLHALCTPCGQADAGGGKCPFQFKFVDFDSVSCGTVFSSAAFVIIDSAVAQEAAPKSKPIMSCSVCSTLLAFEDVVEHFQTEACNKGHVQYIGRDKTETEEWFCFACATLCTDDYCPDCGLYEFLSPLIDREAKAALNKSGKPDLKNSVTISALRKNVKALARTFVSSLHGHVRIVSQLLDKILLRRANYLLLLSHPDRGSEQERGILLAKVMTDIDAIAKSAELQLDQLRIFVELVNNVERISGEEGTSMSSIATAVSLLMSIGAQVSIKKGTLGAGSVGKIAVPLLEWSPQANVFSLSTQQARVPASVRDENGEIAFVRDFSAIRGPRLSTQLHLPVGPGPAVAVTNSGLVVINVANYLKVYSTQTGAFIRDVHLPVDSEPVNTGTIYDLAAVADKTDEANYDNGVWVLTVTALLKVDVSSGAIARKIKLPTNPNEINYDLYKDDEEDEDEDDEHGYEDDCMLFIAIAAMPNGSVILANKHWGDDDTQYYSPDILIVDEEGIFVEREHGVDIEHNVTIPEISLAATPTFYALMTTDFFMFLPSTSSNELREQVLSTSMFDNYERTVLVAAQKGCSVAYDRNSDYFVYNTGFDIIVRTAKEKEEENILIASFAQHPIGTDGEYLTSKKNTDLEWNRAGISKVAVGGPSSIVVGLSFDNQLFIF